jgi:hypothetical protein
MDIPAHNQAAWNKQVREGSRWTGPVTPQVIANARRGQMAAGFVLHGLYEDYWDDASTPLNRWMPTFIATLAIKPA